MKINHNETKNKILSICEILRGQARTANEYHTQKTALLSDETLSEDYKNRKIEELSVAYVREYHATKENINATLEEIAVIETENEKIFDFDIPGYSTAISIINGAKGKLTPEVMESIKKEFAGQHQALIAITSVFENYGINLEPYGYKEYTAKAELALMNISHSVSEIEQSEISTFMSLQKVYKEVIRFGEVRGIKFTDNEKVFGVETATADALARQAMGLS